MLLQSPFPAPAGAPAPVLPTPPHADDLVVDLSVYAPQSDSYLLVEAIRGLGDRIAGARVLDLCCGTGIAAVTAARQRAAEVLALDLNPAAVRSAAANAARHAPAMHARRGCLTDAIEHGPFDVVVCNPPYVPAPRDDVDHASAESAWDAGNDGRSVLDPLCRTLPDLLGAGGVALIVHSEVAGIDTTVEACRDAGLTADVLSRTRIPLGPVMRERRDWLVERGLLPADADTEELAVIRASR
ncbi:HemK2/MTQ2 family protein methyltransferase [Williamsia serinedens]|uniref:Release factor glutamine methyltransferase n=1 Tax=Williamsia serinedens TaxID=391736 RepID=A0ABT1H5N6_9NOCA|nr:HemK2/MTQ2 family protein methyltransferase [Williamsia serinedens]MCP2162451.1 release factor glutamine methyltransferase [Williamsia serinedens]